MTAKMALRHINKCNNSCKMIIATKLLLLMMKIKKIFQIMINQFRKKFMIIKTKILLLKQIFEEKKNRFFIEIYFFKDSIYILSYLILYKNTKIKIKKNKNIKI